LESLGIVLVHGYTGSPDDMAPLTHRLAGKFGNDAVVSVCLPGHDGTSIPAFDADRFEAAVANACNLLLSEGRRPVLVGDSTGGSLAMGYLLSRNITPAMLVLAGTPVRIDGDDLARWEHHRRYRKTVALGDVARMVSYVNRIGQATWQTSFPVLLLSGKEDALVPPARTFLWRTDHFKSMVRTITFPGAGHDLIAGSRSAAVADLIFRTLSDLDTPTPSDLAASQELGQIEPGVWDYIEANPSRAHHLANSPAAHRVTRKRFDHAPVIPTDPIQLNIEITSRCNLACGHCARAQLQRPGKDMDLALFDYLLDLMPHTYKIVLVGLGEPTLHPQVAELVAKAVDQGHTIGLVTNAMTLDHAMSKQLIRAGLRSITFSLDCVDEALASTVRRGTDVERIRGNIDDFLDLAAGSIPTAVFSAISTTTVAHLPELAGVVAQLGVKAWMVSDLNFQANQEASIWKGWCKECRENIGRAIKTAFSHQLPVISVRGIEELGLSSRYHDYLLTSPAELGRRSGAHQWCLSPWQTLPIDVDGNVSLCDCRPDAVIGNLVEDAVSDLWNGPSMQAHRRSMRSAEPPAECRICPRF